MNKNKFFNKELSILEFNKRVLEQAKNKNNPLLERANFLSIVNSNLDEFFMVHMKTNYSNKMNLLINESKIITRELYKEYNKLKIELMNNNITITNNTENIFSFLSSIIINSTDKFPIINNKSLNIIFLLKNNKYLLIQIPNSLNRFYNNTLIEKVIIDKIEEKYDVIEYSIFRILRNAELNYSEDNLLIELENSLNQRETNEIVKMEVSNPSITIINYLKEKLLIKDDYIFIIDGPLDITFLSKLNGSYDLKYPLKESINLNIKFNDIKERDILLYHPYNSFNTILNLLKEASLDPNVISIKQTLYRITKDSKVIDELINASKNGKQVTVLIELKAKFDEANNIKYARILEKAGCNVIYGVKGLKTHCKVLLITRKEDNNIINYAHFSTGNYNEKTTNLYTDTGILTTNKRICNEIDNLFNNIIYNNKIDNTEKVFIAPYNLRDKFNYLINREINNAKLGKKAHIIAKMNSLCDEKIIKKLYKAASLGVKIELIVRGICCLIPNKNITVRSIVGRYLEHNRIYYFYNDNNEEIYIGSADWQERNLNRRIETIISIEDNKIKEKLKEILNIYLSDNTNAYELQTNGDYIMVKQSLPYINSQLKLYEILKE